MVKPSLVSLHSGGANDRLVISPKSHHSNQMSGLKIAKHRREALINKVFWASPSPCLSPMAMNMSGRLHGEISAEHQLYMKVFQVEEGNCPFRLLNGA